MQSLLVLLVLRISTHTLTWSVTGANCVRNEGVSYFNSHAHVERDRGNVFGKDVSMNFNSHAHVERDPTQKELLP